jgi:hypothetical protein
MGAGPEEPDFFWGGLRIFFDCQTRPLRVRSQRAMAVIVSRRPAVCSLAFSPLVAVLALAFVVSSRPGSATCDGGTTSCFSPSLQSGATCTPSNHLQTPGGIATCGGQMWERITCHNPSTSVMPRTDARRAHTTRDRIAVNSHLCRPLRHVPFVGRMLVLLGCPALQVPLAVRRTGLCARVLGPD